MKISQRCQIVCRGHNIVVVATGDVGDVVVGGTGDVGDVVVGATP